VITIHGGREGIGELVHHRIRVPVANAIFNATGAESVNCRITPAS
jgi:hypothetical protein